MGHVVDEDGITTDPDKIQKVLDWMVPESVHSFIGLTLYYRRFIKNYLVHYTI